jgi:hypothetical protein
VILRTIIVAFAIFSAESLVVVGQDTHANLTLRLLRVAVVTQVTLTGRTDLTIGACRNDTIFGLAAACIKIVVVTGTQRIRHPTLSQILLTIEDLFAIIEFLGLPFKCPRIADHYSPATVSQAVTPSLLTELTGFAGSRRGVRRLGLLIDLPTLRSIKLGPLDT